jgi:hypothetical protein
LLSNKLYFTLKSYIKAFYLDFTYLSLNFIFVFLLVLCLSNIVSNDKDFFVMFFDYDFHYLYTKETEVLTNRLLIKYAFKSWFSFSRLFILLYCLYIYTFINILHKSLIFISKKQFSINDEANIANSFILQFFEKGSFTNLIPGFFFWKGLGFALQFRCKLYLNSCLTYNMLTIYREGKKFNWSTVNINPSEMETLLDRSLLKNISLPTSNPESSQVLTKFFSTKPTLFKYKQAILSGDLVEQKTLLHQMSPFDIDLALNSQSALWINFFNTKRFGDEQVHRFAGNPHVRTYFKQSICDIENFLFASTKVNNCHFIHGKQINGYSMYHNASNLNHFHLNQEFKLSSNNDFTFETPVLFKNRLKQTYGKLQEISHTCNSGFHDSLFVSPAERAIRSDAYVISSGDYSLSELKYTFEREFPFKTRFTSSEISNISPNSKIICVDLTKGFQREFFNSEEEFLLFIKTILIDNKLYPLLKEPNLTSKQDYAIVADFIFFESNISKFNVADAFSNINNHINSLKGNSNISFKVTWSIINDSWNL